MHKFSKSDIKEIRYQIKLIKEGVYTASLEGNMNIRLTTRSGEGGRMIYTHAKASKVDKYLKAYILRESPLVKDLI